MARATARYRARNIDLGRLKNIDWAKVIAIDAFVYASAPAPRRDFILRQLKRLFYSRIDVGPALTAEYLCFRSLERGDYKELFDLIVGTIPSSKVVIQDFIKPSSTLNIRMLLNLALNLPLLLKLKNLSIKPKVYVYCRMAFYRAVLQVVARIQFRKLLVFADMQPMDNLLLQAFPDRLSITLQHGLYVDYHDTDTINVVNYRNQLADYFLAWGQDTALLISRYQPGTKAVVCGKPNLAPKPESETGRDIDYFSVVFDQNMYEKYNMRLLEIANQFSELTGIKFNLKMHPWNNPARYVIDRARVIESRPLSMSKFVVGHTTSLLYELLRIGVPAFKLRSPEPALATPDEMQFEDVTELLTVTGRELSPEACIEIGRKYISHYSEESLAQYRAFFDSLDGRCAQNSFDLKTSE